MKPEARGKKQEAGKNKPNIKKIRSLE